MKKRLILFLALVLIPCMAAADSIGFVADGDMHLHTTVMCPFIAPNDRAAYHYSDDGKGEVCLGCIGLNAAGEIADLAGWDLNTCYSVPEGTAWEGEAMFEADEDLTPGMYTAVSSESCMGALTLFAPDGHAVRMLDLSGGVSSTFLLGERMRVSVPDGCVLCAVSDECVPQERLERIEVTHARMAGFRELGGWEFYVEALGENAWYEVTRLQDELQGGSEGRVDVPMGETLMLDMNMYDEIILVELHNVVLWMDTVAVG